jgi:hypothetical protein
MNFFVDRCLPPSLAEMLAVHTRGVHLVQHLSEEKKAKIVPPFFIVCFVVRNSYSYAPWPVTELTPR